MEEKLKYTEQPADDGWRPLDDAERVTACKESINNLIFMYARGDATLKDAEYAACRILDIIRDL